MGKCHEVSACSAGGWGYSLEGEGVLSTDDQASSRDGEFGIYMAAHPRHGTSGATEASAVQKGAQWVEAHTVPLHGSLLLPRFPQGMGSVQSALGATEAPCPPSGHLKAKVHTVTRRKLPGQGLSASLVSRAGGLDAILLSLRR